MEEFEVSGRLGGEVLKFTQLHLVFGFHIVFVCFANQPEQRCATSTVVCLGMYERGGALNKKTKSMKKKTDTHRSNIKSHNFGQF